MTEENATGMELIEPIQDTKVAPATGIAALALNFALKYHDISTVQDGALYQQYKLEGKNMEELHLDMVFETAIRMEQHLMAGGERIANMVVDALTDVITEEQSEQPAPPAPRTEA